MPPWATSISLEELWATAGAETFTPCSSRNVLVPTTVSSPSTRQEMPLPGVYENPSGLTSPRAAPLAAVKTARAKGCSEYRSALAATCSNRSRPTPSEGSTDTTSGFPSVSVPVLSKTTVSRSQRVFGIPLRARGDLQQSLAPDSVRRIDGYDLWISERERASLIQNHRIPIAKGVRNTAPRSRRLAAIARARLRPKDRRIRPLDFRA